MLILPYTLSWADCKAFAVAPIAAKSGVKD